MMHSNKHISKHSNKLQKRLILVCLALILIMSAPVAIAADDALSAINNLTELIYGVCRAAGVLFLIMGVIQLGQSFMEHDPSRRSTAFMSIGGGILVFFVKEIISTITGG